MIDAQTKVYGVFGDPIAHSLSPAMHNAVFSEMGINAVYLPFHVRSHELEGAVAALDSLFNIFDCRAYLKIDKIEDEVIKNPSKNLMVDIMHTKRALIYFSKDLVGNREVVAGIEKEYVLHIEKKIIKQFRNIYNDVVQLIDMVSTYRDILTGAMEIYISSISNNLNTIMKTLTIISAFVLIPTLISGIYGN